MTVTVVLTTLYFAGALTFVVTDPALLGAWPR